MTFFDKLELILLLRIGTLDEDEFSLPSSISVSNSTPAIEKSLPRFLIALETPSAAAPRELSSFLI